MERIRNSSFAVSTYISKKEREPGVLDSLSKKSIVIRPGRCDFNGLGSL